MLDAVTQSKDLISMAEDRCREAEVSQFFSSRMCSPAYAVYSLFICFIFITYPRGLGESALSLEGTARIPEVYQWFCFQFLFLLGCVNEPSRDKYIVRQQKKSSLPLAILVPVQRFLPN